VCVCVCVVFLFCTVFALFRFYPRMHVHAQCMTACPFYYAIFVFRLEQNPLPGWRWSLGLSADLIHSQCAPGPASKTRIVGKPTTVRLAMPRVLFFSPLSWAGGGMEWQASRSHIRSQTQPTYAAPSAPTSMLHVSDGCRFGQRQKFGSAHSACHVTDLFAVYACLFDSFRTKPGFFWSLAIWNSMQRQTNRLQYADGR
jgi:hypothetical protein